jgi:multimeric flavodoxin WrbA
MTSAIVLFGSARRHGNTGAFIDCIARQLGIEVVDLGALMIAPYDYGHGHRDDDFEPLFRRALAFEHLIFASPVYWSAVSPPIKVFLDRITDFLDLPELLAEGRRLRGKTGHVVCTSIYDEPPPPFIAAFRDTFEYLGMRMGNVAHVNCANGYRPAQHDAPAAEFVGDLVRRAAVRRQDSTGKPR